MDVLTRLCNDVLNDNTTKDLPKDFYNRNKGKSCCYKQQLEGFIAGYVENYIIIGFNNERGCIKSFSPQVEYDKSYISYRFSKLKHINLLIKDNVNCK